MIASDEQMPNIRFLGRTRPKPQPGDIFVMHLRTGPWLFGRVILVDVISPGCSLIYVYSSQSETPEPDLGLMTPDHLLIAPVVVNRRGWTRGYWRMLPVHSRPLTPSDRLDQHCFRRVGRFVDERGQALDVPVEPCGVYGITSYEWVDDRVSDALGLPRAPISIGDSDQTPDASPHGYRAWDVAEI